MEKRIDEKSSLDKAGKFFETESEGIYVDRLSGTPLFSSKDKTDTDSVWMNFSKPIEKDVMLVHFENVEGHPTAEVRLTKSNFTIGYIMSEENKPTEFTYCIRPSALKFISKNELVEEGYGEYLSNFEDLEDQSFRSMIYW